MTDTDQQPVHASQLWLSADLAKAKFDASFRSTGAGPVQAANLGKMKTRVFDRTAAGARAFLEWGQSRLAPDQQLCVVMEATGYYSLELAAWLLSLSPGLRVVVVRPKLIKDYMSGIGIRNKTDRIDACAIACYGAERRPEACNRQTEVFLSLRSLTRLRQSLLEQITANGNRLETLSSDHVPAKVRKVVVKSQKSVLKTLEKELETIESEILALTESDPELKRQTARITSIKGVSWKTAAAVLGEMGDLSLYESGRQLGSFAGLNPKLSQSGTKEKKARISKQGSPRVRRALYMASLPFSRHNERRRERK